VIKWGWHEKTENTLVQIYLLGMTNESTEKQRVDKLIRLARSWQDAPELILKSDGYHYDGYEIKEKAYILTKTSSDSKDMHFSLKASSERPLLNPVFVIRDWCKSNVIVKVDGRSARQEEDFRVGYEEINTRSDLILWLKTKSDKTMRLTIKRKD
jgi:hypothetical protein